VTGNGKDPAGVDLAAVYERHRYKVYRYLLRRTGSADEAEELTQRVFADAVDSLARGSRPDSVAAWLFAVAERRFVDEIRRRTRAANFIRAQPEPPKSDLDYGPAVAQALRRSLKRLPDDQREIVVMKIFEGRTFADIADRVGATEAACKMRFSRGIRLLRQMLDQEGFTP
jgi:RNA polymerase sigma-70 factor (ECF subfamily)